MTPDPAMPRNPGATPLADSFPKPRGTGLDPLGPLSWLIMVAPSYLFTIGRVTRMLAENEDKLYDVALDMERCSADA